MASREEVIGGLEFLIQESKRLGAQLSEADWGQVVDMDGWKNKQVLAHIAGISSIVVPMVKRRHGDEAPKEGRRAQIRVH